MCVCACVCVCVRACVCRYCAAAQPRHTHVRVKRHGQTPIFKIDATTLTCKISTHKQVNTHTHTHKQRENVSFDMLCAHSHRHAPDAVQTRADGPCRIERSTGTVKKVGSERRGGREEEKVREGERREADAPPDSSRPLLLQQQPQRPMPILPILTEIRRRAFCASALRLQRCRLASTNLEGSWTFE